MKPYREFDHTGDIGFEVVGDAPGTLFANAGLALADLLYDPDRVRPDEEIGIAVEGRDRADLLVRFLAEILYLYDVCGLQLVRLRFPLLERTRLRAIGGGERFRQQRHRARASIKAVTYHHAEVRRRADGTWKARIVLDV
jgi:SHS2 domain-containing protein